MRRMKKRKPPDRRLYGVHMQRQLYVDKDEFEADECIRKIGKMDDENFNRVAQHVLAMVYWRQKKSAVDGDEKQ